MSLINDALKKAQRERTGDSKHAAPVPGGGSRPPTDVGRPAAFRLQLMLIGGGALLGLLIATGALLFSRRDQAAPVPPAAPVVAAPVPSPSTKIEPPAPPPAATENPPAPAVASSAPAKAAEPEPEIVTLKTSVAEPATAVATNLPPAEPPRATTRFVDAVEALRVMGIRASGTDSKVLMNDRVYRVGDTVNHDLGIKLTGVTANSLSFVDASGATYTRYF